MKRLRLFALVIAVGAGVALLVAGATSAAWAGASKIGPDGFTAVAINDSGAVAGYVGTSPDQQAVVWNAGVTTYLKVPADTVTGYAVGINNLGQAVGTVTVELDQPPPNLQQQAILWDPNGDYTLLGFLAGGTFSSAHDINDSGQVVGVAAPAGGTYTAYLWENGGPMEALPKPPGSTDSFSNAINDAGQIVGSAGMNAVLWDGGVATVLTPLVSGAQAVAVGINDSGQIVGNSIATMSPPFVRHALLWDAASPVDLGSLGGYFAIAQKINNAGQIVGAMSGTDGVSHAYAWENSLGKPLEPLVGDSESYASDINSSGVIIGSSGPFGTARAVMWSPTGADTTPPVLTVPGNVVAPATGPGGVVVTFAATATDENPATPIVSCVPPSGSVFAINPKGVVTLVRCTATDAAGNSASASFTVHVKGAAEQVADLIVTVDGYQLGKLGTTLRNKLVTVQGLLARNKRWQACDKLDSFLWLVKSQSGKGLTVQEATELTTSARRVKTVIGC